MPLGNFDPKQYPELHPIFIACRRGDEDAVRMHLEAGTSVDIDDTNHASLIATAIEGGHAGIVTILPSFGLNPDKEINRFGETPLLRALAEKNLNVIRALIEGGASVNKSDPRGFTPLMSAAAGGDVEAMELLVKLGADLDAKSERGRTALRPHVVIK
jgi:uncharacterized protein